MPWDKSNLPEAVKGLPEYGQEIWQAAANSALKQYGDEGKAIATAWAAVKKAGYAKGDDGKWHKVELDEDHAAGIRLAQIQQTGKHWGPVLRHVAFLGAQAPAVKGMTDIAKLGPGGTIEDLVVCKVGTWNGKEVTAADLDKMVENFEALRGVEDVPVLMAAIHDEAKLDEILRREGLPAFGWVDGLRRMGTDLVARLRDVPKVVADLIFNKRFPKRSIRYTPDYVFGEAKLGEVSVFIEIAPEKEGEQMGDEKKFTEEDLAAKVKAAVKQAEEAKDKEIKELAEERDKKQKALDEQAKKAKEAKIASFCERLTAEKLAPKILKQAQVVLAAIPDEGEVTLAEDKKGTQLDAAIAFLDATVKAGKEAKLFVDTSERGQGGDFDSPGQGEAAKDKELVEEIASGSDRTRAGQAKANQGK